MEKKRVLLVGMGGVGTMAGVNLELGGLAEVTAVCRSNYEHVTQHGFDIDSCDHGKITGWKPSHITNTIPNASPTHPFDYIVLSTKNTPDIPPSLPSLIAPAVTPSHTTILLLQNGLSIERPFQAAFPQTIILSGISMIGSHELAPGKIQQEDPDELIVGAFDSQAQGYTPAAGASAAADFVRIYSAGGKTVCKTTDNVAFSRWRKLVYNACLNPICALTGLDSARVRLASSSTASLVETIVRPAMLEILAAAAACGHVLPETLPQTMIEVDPLDLYLKPSMQVDVEKGNYIEVEALVGEPLREGESKGVSMPTVRMLYVLGRAYQWKVMESKGLVEVPPKKGNGTK